MAFKLQLLPLLQYHLLVHLSQIAQIFLQVNTFINLSAIAIYILGTMKRTYPFEQAETEKFFQKRRKNESRVVSLVDSQQKQDQDQEMIRFTVARQPQKATKQQVAPWMTSRTKDIKDSLLRFHNEIIEFCEYVSPTKVEHQFKQKALADLTKLIKQTVGDCEVQAFGSFATGLYLPDGDIDVAVIIEGQDDRKVYQAIYSAILKKGDEYCEVDYIRKSKVPLIKFIKTQGWIQFDLSVNKEDGINQLSEVKKMVDCFPQFRYLAMVLKCILKIRNLGQTYSGGLGSFLLFCMLLVYLREMQSKGRYYTLSEHLLRFMEYYSITNDWSKKRVYVASGLIEERKGEDSYFSFMSPQDPDHDVGKSAFKIRDVFSVFRNRFRMILGKNFKKGQSVLKELVNPSEGEFIYLK